jgi:hypothetical protein
LVWVGEVLGFYTLQSTDHHWSPRLLLFLCKEGYQSHQARITSVLSEELPYTFCGFSTNFGELDEIGVHLLEEIEEGRDESLS